MLAIEVRLISGEVKLFVSFWNLGSSDQPRQKVPKLPVGGKLPQRAPKNSQCRLCVPISSLDGHIGRLDSVCILLCAKDISYGLAYRNIRNIQVLTSVIS